MATKSLFSSRLSISRDDTSPVFPLFQKSTPRRSVRHKPSEYDMRELSPQAEDSLLASDTEPAFSFEPARMAASSSMPRQRGSPLGSPSFEKHFGRPPLSPNSNPPPRVLFAGPPPPIATSVLLYKDVEDRGGSIRLPPDHSPGGHLGASLYHLLPGSVLFDHSRPSTGRQPAPAPAYDGGSIWANLQRRERSLQKDVQRYLDIQSAGLLAGLGRGPEPSGEAGDSWSNSRGNTPTTESVHTTSMRSARLPTDRANSSGAIIPVRQPPRKKLGLRGARSGLTKSLAQLADLKAEENRALETALNARKRALAQLRKLANRQERIASELQSLEADDDEPLTQELATLTSAHADTDKQIAELEKQLAMLRSRKRTLEGRIADARSQRDAGLSGYRGAREEVDKQLMAVLHRPPVLPLDLKALGGGVPLRLENGSDTAPSPGGVEFMRLRPERRTAEMARLWWEGEVEVLKRRQLEVETERSALEEGSIVWREAMLMVSSFEADLRKEMSADSGNVGRNGSDGSLAGKGKTPELSPEEKLRAQLSKMADVAAGLNRHLRTAEDKHWNLLICAIGAELEAFQEARQMLRDALQAAGIYTDGDGEEDVGGSRGSRPDIRGIEANDDEDTMATPRLAQSVSKATPAPHAEILVDTSDNSSREGRGTSESEDNEVPADLFAASPDAAGQNGPEDSSTRGRSAHEHLHDKDDSENEVPLEFLSEHQADQDA